MTQMGFYFDQTHQVRDHYVRAAAVEVNELDTAFMEHDVLMP